MHKYSLIAMFVFCLFAFSVSAQSNNEKAANEKSTSIKIKLPGPLKLEEIEIGEMDTQGNIEIKLDNEIKENAKEIFCVLKWTGAGSGKSVEIQWIYEDMNFLIDRSFFDFPDQDGGNAEIKLPALANKWPIGNYRIDVLKAEEILISKSFKIISEGN